MTYKPLEQLDRTRFTLATAKAVAKAASRLKDVWEKEFKDIVDPATHEQWLEELVLVEMILTEFAEEVGR